MIILVPLFATQTILFLAFFASAIFCGVLGNQYP
jgi:hypothetical protein